MAAQITTAAKNNVITRSTFKGYDACCNPYVGCEFGCQYCYVRFFVKDKTKEWGEFVRLRMHIKDKLPKELPRISGQRLVIGTMTDPYQPVERKYHLTRTIMQEILKQINKPSKVGIFTRSPIILDDIQLIKQLPKARIHYTITPYNKDILQKLEPIPVSTEARFKVCQKIVDAGIRLHINVAPVLPHYSDHLTVDFVKRIVAIKPAEFFVDPMMAYSESYTATEQALSTDKDWPNVQNIITNKQRYQEWKEQYKQQWLDAWNKYGNNSILPIWSDHQSGTWIDMRTEQQMDHRIYGDDL